MTIVAIALLLNINVTQAHWHHTMECWCSSFRTVLILEQLTKWYLSRVLISVKFNYMYFMTSLGGKNEVQVKFERSMHNYNVTLVHWHTHWDVSAVVLVLMLFTKWYPSEYWYFMTSLQGSETNTTIFVIYILDIESHCPL